jgi:hypothetical protein
MSKLTKTLLESDEISQGVFRLLELQTQLKVFHWNTFSHAQHEAFGDTQATLDDLIDSFIEGFQGLYGRISFGGLTITIGDLEDVAVIDYLRLQLDYLAGMSNHISDTNLLNIRDEMLQAVSKLLYLLTLE